MSYRAIGFDYGGVINGELGIVFTKSMAKFLGVPLHVLQKVFFENNHRLSVGGLSWVEMWQYITNLLGCPEKHQSVVDFISNSVEAEARNMSLSRRP
jgi:hypothetical protein